MARCSVSCPFSAARKVLRPKGAFKRNHTQRQSVDCHSSSRRHRGDCHHRGVSPSRRMQLIRRRWFRRPPRPPGVPSTGQDRRKTEEDRGRQEEDKAGCSCELTAFPWASSVGPCVMPYVRGLDARGLDVRRGWPWRRGGGVGACEFAFLGEKQYVQRRKAVCSCELTAFLPVNILLSPRSAFSVSCRKLVHDGESRGGGLAPPSPHAHKQHMSGHTN